MISVAEKPSADLAVALGARRVYFIVEPNRDHLIELGKFVDEGRLRPIVSSVLPLEQAREAYQLGLRYDGADRGRPSTVRAYRASIADWPS